MPALINIHLSGHVEFNKPAHVGVPQPHFVNVDSVSRSDLGYQLANVTDPLRANSFRQTVAQEHPVHVLIRMRPNARSRPVSGATNPRKFNRRTQPRNWLVVSTPK